MRVLVVEDEKKVAGFIKKGLEEELYAADIASDGEEGLSLAENENYDLIILDIMLPKIEGLEVLSRLRKNKITIRPIAGTRPRGLNAKKDKFYKNQLLNDKKELSEHLMLLDLGRNDVGKVSKVNSVKVTEQFKIEKYSHVMHIVSNVEGKFDEKQSLLNTMLSGFPAGTVTGAPKIRAMEIIDELEKSKRKMYAGSIGYFSANKNFDTCIALRTALIKDNKFYIQSGAGIVADSIPEKEYLETVNKAKALINSLN